MDTVLLHLYGSANGKMSKVQDMLRYQALIIEAGMEYKGDGWSGHDLRFRQTAAASPDVLW